MPAFEPTYSPRLAGVALLLEPPLSSGKGKKALVTMEFIIGILIGFTIGATGVGGGTLMGPTLMFVLGFSPRAAVATALLFSASIKVLASAIYLWQQQIDRRVLAYSLYGGVPGTILGALILEELRSKKSEAWVSLTVGILVIVSAVLGLFRFRTSDAKARKCLYALPFFSFVIGSETAFSSAGTGALGTIMLLNFTDLAPAAVIGTDLVFGLIISTIAGGIHARSCDYAALCRLIPAGIAGGLAGAHISLRLPMKKLRKTVLLCVVAAGILLLQKGIAGII